MFRELFQPYPLAMILVWSVVGLICYRRREKRWVLALLLGSLSVITTVSLPVVARLLFQPLENSYSTALPAEATADDPVVVLGGYASKAFEQDYAVLDADSFSRCMHAITLQQNLDSKWLIVSGGDPNGRLPVAPVMAQLIEAYGVPNDRIIVESTSRNTFENARDAVPILEKLGKKRIVLVTNAGHMNRSVACFRKLGYEVIPAPCYFRSRGEIKFRHILPNPKAPGAFMEGLHEIVGLAWYKLRGYSQ